MSSDFRDMIGVGKSGKTTKPASVKKRKIGSDRPKQKGMAREVSWLIQNEDLPSIVPTTTTSTLLKEKRRLEAVPWKYVEFTNSARSDGLNLRHWAKQTDEGKDYKFAKFHKKPFIIRYTEEEYRIFFVDSKWSKADTDQLFDLLERFELKFHVVADRMDPPKSVDLLKARYYQIVSKLAEIRKLRKPVDPSHPNGPSELHPFIGYSFNLSAEKERRRIFERMYHRTREQEREEQYLLTEAKRIESGLRDKSALGTDDMAMLAGLTVSTSGGLKSSKRFKKSRLSSTPSLPKPVNPVPLSLPASSRSKGRDEAVLVLPANKPGPWVRSAKMLLPHGSSGARPELAAKCLADLGLVKQLPATEEISDCFGLLLDDIKDFLALQKQLQRKEYEVKMLSSQVEHLDGAVGQNDEKRAVKRRKWE